MKRLFLILAILWIFCTIVGLSLNLAWHIWMLGFWGTVGFAAFCGILEYICCRRKQSL